MRRRLLLTLPVLATLPMLLAGCKLVDQKTFAPSPEAKPPPPPGPPAPPPRTDPRNPLVVIDFAKPHPEYHSLLEVAVHAAEERDRNVQFDVVSVGATIDAASAAQDNAVEVMRAILEEHVAATRVHLGVRADPAVTGPQVRIFVR